MILSTLVIALLSADGGSPPFVDLKEDAERTVGTPVTVRGMVRTLPSIESPSLPTGIALDDGTPIYLEGDSVMARVWAMLIGQYGSLVGELTPLPTGGFKLKTTATFRLGRRTLDHLDGKEVFLEGLASKARAGAPTLLVERIMVQLPKLAAWPEATYRTFVIMKGTMRRTPDGWALESSEWKPAERKPYPPAKP